MQNDTKQAIPGLQNRQQLLQALQKMAPSPEKVPLAFQQL